jgi:multidrug efflux pump subunit AcrA (membrane-fusion protein)
MAQEPDIQITGPRSIAIRPDSPIFNKLRIVAVNLTETIDPIVSVSGVDVASLQTNGIDHLADTPTVTTPVSVDKLNDFWQFHSTELLTTFADWQKADADITFAEKQLQSVETLAEATLQSQQLLVERLEKLVRIGTETEKDLAEAKATLIQTQIQGQKDVYEAQSAVRLAQREKATLAKQLALEGLQPELLISITRDIDIIMAEVPESMIKHVKIGQSCVARFFSHSEKRFYGKVLSIVPVLSKELRSLRVLLAIEDAGDLLCPGMFAEIGLGVDPRFVLSVPPESVVHVGESDYVLIRKSDTDWTVTEVQIGELHETGVEIHNGLTDGDQVAGKGVILLKPMIAESLRLR